MARVASKRVFLRRHGTVVAAVSCLFLPFLLAPGLLLGTSAMGPEHVLDGDALFGITREVSLRPYDDKTAIHLDYPRDSYLASRVRQGHLDLWNPIQGFGMPLLSGQGGILFPLRLLYYAFPSPTSYVILRLARLFVAGLGAYLLARVRGLTFPAALGAATLFEICGGVVAQAPFMTTTPTMMLPWVLLGMELLRRRRWRIGVIALAAAVGLTILGGHQTLVAVVGVGAGGYALGAAIGAGRRAPRLVGAMAIGVVLGVLLSGPVLLPFLELLKHGHSYKWTDRAMRDWQFWLYVVRKDSLIGFAAPLLVDAMRDKQLVIYPYVFHATVGLLASSLAFVALASRRWSAPLLAMFVAGVVFAFVPPGFTFIGRATLLRDVLPRYFWPLLAIPVSQWAGMGADVLACIPRVARRRGASPARLLLRAVLVGTGGVLATCGAAFLTMHHRWYYGFEEVLVAEKLRVAAPLVALPTVMLAALALFRRRPERLRAVLLAAAAVELAVYVQPLVSEPPSKALRGPIPAAAARLAHLVEREHGRIGAVTPTLSIAQIPMLATVADSRMTSALVPERYATYLAAAGARTNSTLYSLPAGKPAFLDLCAVRYVLGPRSQASRLLGDTLRKHVFDTNGASVYENRGAAPRARLLHRTEVVPGLEQAGEALVAGLPGRAHLAEGMLLDTLILEPTAGAPPPPALEGGESEAAEILRLEPDRVRVRTRSDEAGYLVLADLYYPGWHASVDGREQPIYPADVAFRAVYVPSGEHTVVFRYRPLSVRLGCGAFVLASLGLAAIAIVPRSRVLTLRRGNGDVSEVVALSGRGESVRKGGRTGGQRVWGGRRGCGFQAAVHGRAGIVHP